MTPTGTHFNYYQICRRKLWLFANGISMEHTSDTVYDGKLIPGERRYSLCLDVSEIFKPIIIDRVIFRVLNRREIQEKHFDKKLNRCLLNESGKKVFVRAIEDKLEETFQHKSLGRKVSFRHLIKLECYKLAKHLLGIEDYKPFKTYY